MENVLIDRIYECAVVPELWPTVLDELAARVDARGGQLFAVRDKMMSWTTSAALADVFKRYVDDGWFAKCDRRICLFTQNKPTFLAEYDFWTTEELEKNEIYSGFFRPNGLGWSANTGLAMPTKDNIVFTVERDYARGPIEKESIDLLNSLRPHLARAGLIAARLNLKTVEGTSNVLAALGIPALVLDETGVVLEANALMQALQAHIQWRALDRIALTDKTANALLWSALPNIGQSAQTNIQSFAIRGDGDRAAMVVHILPIKRSANDIFGGSHALLVATPVTAGRAPSVELLRSLFDLTPSEARVARGIAAGESLDTIASNGDVSRNTVRTQLQLVMDKTGCSRQSEVTSLLSSIATG
jgi:DNA-binding CsgD family transcriptional regulator